MERDFLSAAILHNPLAGPVPSWKHPFIETLTYCTFPSSYFLPMCPFPLLESPSGGTPLLWRTLWQVFPTTSLFCPWKFFIVTFSSRMSPFLPLNNLVLFVDSSPLPFSISFPPQTQIQLSSTLNFYWPQYKFDNHSQWPEVIHLIPNPHRFQQTLRRKCHMLFYSTEKLALEMGFGTPALDPSIFVGKLPRHLYPGSDWNLTL